MIVSKLIFNWRQVGSTIARDGAGENYDFLEVGRNGVVKIEEFIPNNPGLLWNYMVYFEDGKQLRIFNPNSVEYAPE